QAVVEPVDLLVQPRDLRAEASIDTVDFVVEGGDLRAEPSVDTIDFLVQGGDLRAEPSIDTVDFRAQTAVDAVNLHAEPRVNAGDLFVEHTNVAANRLALGREDALERRLDLVVKRPSGATQATLIPRVNVTVTMHGAPAVKPAPRETSAQGLLFPETLLQRRERSRQ